MTATLGSGESIEDGFTFVSDNSGDKGLDKISGQSFDFEISDDETYLLSCFPSELDFYDQKRGHILRPRGKKQSLKGKATKKCPRKQRGSGVPLAIKERRIRETRTENSRRKKENKVKTRVPTRCPVANPERKQGKVHEDERSLAKANGEFPNQTITPATYYNNSDFILSPRHGVKIADQAFLNVLIELQNRDITPEDYDLLLRLDCSVKPKTLSQAKINRLRSDTVNGTLKEVCTICLEDYTPGQETIFLPCGHYFHGQCIQEWLRWTSKKCPIDGKEVQ